MKPACDPHGLSALVLAGGTGGHVYPALAVAEALRDLGWRVQWLGSRDGMEGRIVPQAGFCLHAVRVRGLRGKGLVKLLFGPAMLFLALVQSAKVIWTLRPSLVLGMGGFVAGPAGLAAWLLRRPLVIHEQNAVPGVTNRLLAPFARLVLEAFPGSFSRKWAGKGALTVRHTGNPLRGSIVALEAGVSDDASLRVLILGGSQGAVALNERMPEVIRRLLATHGQGAVSGVHQAGHRHLEATRQRYEGLEGIEVRDFLEDMAAAYRAADLVICRAGAMTIAEVSAAGRASVLVPFPHAVDDHQTFNARYLSDYGAAILLPQERASVDALVAHIERFIENRALTSEMGRAAYARAVSDATARVIACCEEVARG